MQLKDHSRNFSLASVTGSTLTTQRNAKQARFAHLGSVILHRLHQNLSLLLPPWHHQAARIANTGVHLVSITCRHGFQLWLLAARKKLSATARSANRTKGKCEQHQDPPNTVRQPEPVCLRMLH